MRANHKIQDETCPKLPIQCDQHIEIMTQAGSKQNRTKMKFNWRANWEILLVLVIIIIGIVITTIAAVRSKDKQQQLLVLPDEADYGSDQAAISSQHQVPPLPQTDFQFQTGAARPLAADDFGGGGGGGDSAAPPPQRATSSPFAATLTTTTTTSGNPKKAAQQQLPNSHLGHHQQHQHHSQAASAHRKSPPRTAGFGPVDQYDALSTEATPSQLNDTARPAAAKSLGTNSRRNVHSQQQQQQQLQRHRSPQQQPSEPSEPLNEQVELLDDFHTTRSALAAQPGEMATQAERVADEQHVHALTPPPLQMHGPYELTPTLTHNHPHNYPSATVDSLQPLNDQRATSGSRDRSLQYAQNKSQAQFEQMAPPPPQPPQPPPPTLEPDDMMTSYSRMPTQGNLTDSTTTMLRDYNSASANDSTPSSATPKSSDGGGGGGSLSMGRQRAGGSAAASLPFSMLLGDLIRLTRPNSQQQQQLINSQASLEPAANSRPQFSILQQLRSLPGPLLALLQGSSALTGAGGVGGQELSQVLNQANGGGGGGGNPTTSNDASESSQHYQRISMAASDVTGLLSRSLRAVSGQGGALPAFPPPKGTPQQWVPSTSGGAPINDPVNGNADFIASNTAGFLRAAQSSADPQQQQQQQQSADNSQQVNNYQQQQQQQATVELQQQQQQQQQQAYMYQNNQMQAALSNAHNQQGNLANIYNQAQMGQSGQQQPAQVQMYSQMKTNSEPTFDANFQNNNQVPLGYNPQAQQSILSQPQQQQQQQLPAGFQMVAGNSRPTSYNNFNSLGAIESAPKAVLMPAAAASPVNSYNNQPAQNKPAVAAVQGPQPIQLNAIGRQKRSLPGLDDFLERRQEGSESLDDDEEEEYLDSRPMSIVSPDGRPMTERVKILRNSQQRPLKQHDLDESALHHYAAAAAANGAQNAPSELNHGDNQRATAARRQRLDGSTDSRAETNSIGDRARPATGARKAGGRRPTNGKASESHDRKLSAHSDNNNNNKQALGKRRRNKQPGGHLETASSGLMSKLLGTASTNDELEDDLDNDNDDDGGGDAGERRKEEQDEAEFGISREPVDRPQSAGGHSLDSGSPNSISADPNSMSAPGDVHDVSRLTHSQQENNQNESNQDPSLGSGSAAGNSYSRRHPQQQQQQRSDVEFYGHPGEETRQLKYGILGSGNYEVVNGGIYPDVDESTAAVNSVANYVRKPGNVLLASLPKLLAAAGSTSAEGPDAFMPGGRMAAGPPPPPNGYMRDASAHSDELANQMFPPPPLGSAKLSPSHLTNPLLELIDANSAHLFDPSLIGQLGSSGTSARTTFSSKDDDNDANQLDDDNDDNDQHRQQQYRTAAEKSGARKATTNKKDQFNNTNSNKKRNKVAAANGRTKADEGQLLDIEQSQHQHASSALANSAGSRRSKAHNQQAAMSGSKGQGTNQFYSYQILPSKKVTIFSDQDLDSAPSELLAETRIRRPPPHEKVATAA